MADAYKALIPSVSLPTTAGTLGTVPGAASWIPSRWTVVNVNANGYLWFQLFKNGTDGLHAITGIIGLQAGGYASEDFLGAMATTEFIAGVASGPGLSFTLEGDQVT